MKKPLLLTCLLWSCALGASNAQATGARDPIAGAVIPPDVVMTHQAELGLSDAQKTAIQGDAQKAQQHFSGLQEQLSAAVDKLAVTLRATQVDQGVALAQLDAVLALEREIKHAQLTLLVEVKNELTAQQQAKARQFMPASSP